MASEDRVPNGPVDLLLARAGLWQDKLHIEWPYRVSAFWLFSQRIHG
jgi:hypothetical protein